MRRLLAVAVISLVAVGFVACGDDADRSEGSDRTTAPAGSTEPGSTVPANALQVVALGDSNVEGAGVDSPEDAYPYLYADRLSEELGVPVQASSYYPGEVRTLDQWTKLLGTDEEMRADVADADVVLLLVGFHDIVPELVFGECSYGWPDPLRACVRAATRTMPADFDAFYDAVADAAPPGAKVLVADYAIPPIWYQRWSGDPEWPAIKRTIFDDWHGPMVASAERHGFTVVPMSSTLNGPDGEPLHPETLADGYHFNDAGMELMAEIHQQADGLPADAATATTTAT